MDKKKSRVFICSLFILILFISFVSAGFFKEILKEVDEKVIIDIAPQIVKEEIVPICSDTDEGINIFEKGYVYNLEDVCYNKTAVNELSCEDPYYIRPEGMFMVDRSDSGIEFYIASIHCPVDYPICLNGACTKEFPIFSTENKKDMSRYAAREVFLISDKDWKTVLPLIPLTIWTGSEDCSKGYGTPEDVCVYPTLIFHEEKGEKFLDLTFGSQVIVSSSEEAPASLVLDSDIYTSWNSGSTDQAYLELHFQDTKQFNRIDLFEQDDNYYVDIYAYKIEFFEEDLEIIDSRIDLKYIEEFDDEILGEEVVSKTKLVENYALEIGQNVFEFETINADYLEFVLRDNPDQTSFPNWKTIAEIKVYGEEKFNYESFDADSIIYFMQQYGARKATIVGETPQELDNLLIAEPELGAGLRKRNVQRISTENYFSYWEKFEEIVYVEDDYELALLASTYASLINAPLIIKGTNLDKEENFEGTNIICVGNLKRACNEQYTLIELQQKYVKETNTDKIILINPNDLNVKVEEEFQPEKSKNIFYELYSKTSLASPILASAKHEILISTAETNDQNVNRFLENKIVDLKIVKGYLTMISSPNIIPFFNNEYGTDSVGRNLNPSILIDSSKNIHVIWEGYDEKNIFYTKLDNLGNKIIKPKIIDNLKGIQPKILIDSNDNLHLFFFDERNERLFYTKLNEEGNILIDFLKIDPCQSKTFSIAIDSNDDLHLLCRRNYDLYYHKLDNNGIILINNLKIAEDAFDPAIVTDLNKNVHMVWVQSIPVARSLIYYKKLDNEGNILIDNLELNSGEIYSLFPAITNDLEDNIHIVWIDSNFRVQYVKMADKNILINEMELTSSYSGHPLNINADLDKNIYVFWDNGFRKFDSLQNTWDPVISGGVEDVVFDLDNVLHGVFSDYVYGEHSIFYKKYINSWSENKPLSFSFFLNTGRIYGLTTSDVSSYMARAIFYEELFTKTYDSGFTGISVAHDFSSMEENAQKIKELTTSIGYNSVCYTGEFIEGCIQNVKPLFSEYKNKQFITFGGHGGPTLWSETMDYSEIPWLDLPYVFANSCLTNKFVGATTFGANILRKGAIGYNGAIRVTTKDAFPLITAIEFLTSNEEVSLGRLHTELFNSGFYKKDYVLLGDPTLLTIFKKIDS